jgi:hypothetical protein
MSETRQIKAVYSVDAGQALTTLQGLADSARTAGAKMDDLIVQSEKVTEQTEKTGEGMKKLSVLFGQQGLAGDIEDISDGFRMLAPEMGTATMAIGGVTVAIGLAATGMIAAHSAIVEFGRGVIESESKIGSLSPALKGMAKNIQEADTASAMARKTLAEGLAPALEQMSGPVNALKVEAAGWAGSLAETVALLAKVIDHYTTLGNLPIVQRLSGTSAAIAAQANIDRARAKDEAKWGNFEQPLLTQADIDNKAAEQAAAEEAAAKKAAEDAANLSKAVRANTAAQDAAALAAYERLRKEAEAVGVMGSWVADLRAGWQAGGIGAGGLTQYGAVPASVATALGGTTVTATGGGWAFNDAWSQSQQALETPAEAATASGITGAQALGGVTSALGVINAAAGAKPMDAAMSAIGAMGPYGAAIAAGLELGLNPKTIDKLINGFLKIIDKLPEILENVLTEVLPALIMAIPEIFAKLMYAILVDIPRMIANAIADLFRKDKTEPGKGPNPYQPGTAQYLMWEKDKQANQGRALWSDQYGSREQTSRSARAPYLDPRLGSGIIPGAQMAGVTVNLQAVGSIPDQAADEIVRAISRAQRRGVR